MARYDYPLYDTALFGTTANTTHTLFQNGQGSSSTKGSNITNMRGGGQLPDKERFYIKGVGVHVDDIGLSDDDIQGLFMGSILTIEYDNLKVFQVPTYICSDKNRVGGVKTEATASAFDYFGQEGDAYQFSNEIFIEGGKNITVTITQPLAMDTASMDIKVVLYGDLDTPSFG